MINPFLAARLQPVIKRLRRRQLAVGMACWWTIAAVAGWAAFLRGQPPVSTEYLPDFIVMALLGAGVVWLTWYLLPVGFKGMARRIERKFPALDGRLLTAVQVDQENEEDGAGEIRPLFIRERLLSQAMQHSVDHDWTKAVGPMGGVAGPVTAGVAVLAFVAVLAAVPHDPEAPAETLAAVSQPEAAVKLADGVEITPGDTELEKGSSLVVAARFTQAVPESVNLVASSAASVTPAAPSVAAADNKNSQTSRTVVMTRSLRDPVFGGSLPEVTADFRYHIEYDGRSTREFTVKVFEYPRLEQSDATIAYPEWTKLKEKRIEDTRRVSAVEGSRVSLALKLNKPVASAILKPRPGQPAEVKEVKLAAAVDQSEASLADFPLTRSGTYDLILTDAQGRMAKVPPVFTFEALPDQVPEIKLAQPRGDQTPSALEELVFAGTARDDFGLLAWGLAFTMGGGEPEYVELGKEAPGGEVKNFDHLLRLEEKGVKPDDLVSWFVWADDIGPDGKRRRTQGDMFFGEIRPFDQIFRQGQGQEGEQQQRQQAGAQQGGPGAKLAELQKQIINATWKLRREAAPKASDVAVVRDSERDAVTQAEEAAGENEDPRLAPLWEKAKAALKEAADSLGLSAVTPESLASSLALEQTAYQALLKLSAREFQITRQQRSSGSQSQADQRMQEQLNEMELTEEKNRYEKEREAQAPQEAERREDRQVLNRLQELAKRQEEVNERLKELQTALQAAENQEEKEKLERELKRLEEEQRNMLADVDELNQRMERPENQQRMSQQQQQLEQARQNARQAAEEAAKGNAAEALASGTRAQRQLQDMREDLRKRTSDGLSTDLRDMRSQARELASQQRDLVDRLQKMENPQQKILGADPERDAALKTLSEQKRRSEELTKKAAEISESAETAEPLVSRQLYDSMRKYAQADAAGVKQAQEEMLRSGEISRQMYRQLQEMQNREKGAKTLDLTSDLLQEDLLTQAQGTGRHARDGIEDFKTGIEKAAENVVGDDTEALKRADRQLESLTQQLADELAQATGEPVEGMENVQSAGSNEGNGIRSDGSSPPGEGKNAPGEGKNAPGEGKNAPGEGKNAPGEGKNAPGEGKNAPGEGKNPSSEGKNALGDGKNAPSDGKNAPSERQEQGPQGQQGQGEGQQGQGEGQQGQGEGQQGQGQGQQGQGQGQQGQDRNEGGRQQRGSGGGSQRGNYNRGGLTAGGGGGFTGGPVTGEDFIQWSDGLRDVQELVEFPDLQNRIADARESARRLRVESKKDLKKPDWAVVKSEILTPLVEVRKQVREELRRRQSSEALVPIDRDPVPGRYSEQVRRYYEQLGKD